MIILQIVAWLIGSPSSLITVPVIRPSGCAGSLVCAHVRGAESRRRMPVASQDECVHELLISYLVYTAAVCVQTVQAVNFKASIDSGVSAWR